MFSKISLNQIELNDFQMIKKVTNNLLPYTSTGVMVTQKEIDLLYSEKIKETDSYYFSIKGLKDGFKLINLGFCSINKINWVNRNGELFFGMISGGSSIPNNENARSAFSQIMKFGFNELNLNKISIESAENDDVREVLSDFGFVVEGIVREALFKRGEFSDVVVYSLLAQEYRERL